jgi:hypothetical protein
MNTQADEPQAHTNAHSGGTQAAAALTPWRTAARDFISALLVSALLTYVLSFGTAGGL